MKTFKVTLKRSLIGATKKQRETIRCLGLRKIGASRVIKDTPAQRGQLYMMQQWLEIEASK